jgi:hypothetical protein
MHNHIAMLALDVAAATLILLALGLFIGFLTH